MLLRAQGPGPWAKVSCAADSCRPQPLLLRLLLLCQQRLLLLLLLPPAHLRLLRQADGQVIIRAAVGPNVVHIQQVSIVQHLHQHIAS